MPAPGQCLALVRLEEHLQAVGEVRKVFNYGK